MKKTLSILLAVILALSAFTMVSFAEETEITEVTTAVTDEPTETPDESTDAPTDFADSMYAKFLDKHINDGNFLNTELALELSAYGEDGSVNVYIKDGKLAAEASRKIGLFSLKFKMIVDINSKEVKIYFPVLPFFYISYDVPGEIEDVLTDDLFIDYSDLVLERVGKVQVSGTEYYFEQIKYYDEQINGEIKAYFKDGELVHIETIEDGSFVGVGDISYEVSDKDVELPFYAFIDVTPLIDLFDSLFGLM